MLAALALTVFMSSSLVFVDGGRLAFNVRETYAAVARMAEQRDRSRAGTPGVVARQRETALSRRRDLASPAGAAWLGLRKGESTRWLRSRGALAAATGGAYAAAGMVALTIVWILAGADGRNMHSGAAGSASPSWLRASRAAFSRCQVFTGSPFRMCRRSSGWSRGRQPRRGAPVQTIVLSIRSPSIPAGRYRLRPRGSGDGRLAHGRHWPRSVLAPERTVDQPAAANRPRFSRRRARDRCPRRRAGAPHGSLADDRATVRAAGAITTGDGCRSTRGAVRGDRRVLSGRSQLSRAGSLLGWWRTQQHGRDPTRRARIAVTLLVRTHRSTTTSPSNRGRGAKR